MCSINHDKKAIFIHIPKTAGCYIRENLSRHYGFTTFLSERVDHIEYCKPDPRKNLPNTARIGTSLYDKGVLSICSRKNILDYYNENSNENSNEIILKNINFYKRK